LSLLPLSPPDPFPYCQPLSSFQLPDTAKISDLIRKSKTSTFQVMPSPQTWLNPASLSASPHICHHPPSLTARIVPSLIKTAAVTPVLKKNGLDPNNYINLHPISNLPFIAKIFGKVVATELHSYLTQNSLYEPFQPVFCSGHSTETTCIKIIKDLLS